MKHNKLDAEFKEVHSVLLLQRSFGSLCTSLESMVHGISVHVTCQFVMASLCVIQISVRFNFEIRCYHY